MVDTPTQMQQPLTAKLGEKTKKPQHATRVRFQGYSFSPTASQFPKEPLQEGPARALTPTCIMTGEGGAQGPAGLPRDTTRGRREGERARCGLGMGVVRPSLAPLLLLLH